jgi:hypothetical protein
MYSKVMKVFSKTKPLVQLLRELPVGQSIIIPNTQARNSSVRFIVSKLRKEGFEMKATQRGLTNKIQVTKIK